jgi:hypothetical protein
MPHSKRWLAASLVLGCLPASACGAASEFDSEAASDEGPAKVEPIKGTDVARVTLTPQAVRRLGVATAPVRLARVARGGPLRPVIPYAAVLYDAEGNAFAFTSPQPRVFVRRPITVDYIRNGRAVLKSGPRPGTPVVTVASAELLGTENGVEEE